VSKPRSNRRKARKPKPQATPPSGTPRGMSGLSGLSGLATHGYK
jgi:hypothetical protein